MKSFADPRCQAAMQEMQENPEAASKKYKNDKYISEFLKEFMGLMGDHFSNLADDADSKAQKETEQKTKDEAAAAAASQQELMSGPLADPAVQAIMSDPEFQPILQMCGKPGYFTRYFTTCNLNANFVFRIFRLKMQKEWRIVPEKR